MRRGINWLIVGIVGVVLIVVVLLFNFLVVPWAIHYQVGNTIALRNGTDAWARFLEVPVPIHLKIYIFEVLNPDEVALGAKPRVEEIGPYVYSEKRTRHVIAEHDDTDTIEYTLRMTFFFNETLSNGLTEDDTIHVLNPIMIGMMQIVEGMPMVERLETLLDFGLPEILGPARGTPVIKTTVKEFLFKGFDVYCNQTSPNGATRLLCSSFHRFMPLKLLTPTDDGNFRFALLKYKNGTDDGPYEVYSGNKNIDNLGKIKTWKGLETTSVWSGSPCNIVRGSDTSLLPPFLTKSTSLYIFNSDVCAGTRLVYNSSASYQGISGYRFVPGPEFMSSVEDHKENYCFCPGSIKGLTKPSGCLKTGILDVSSCLQVPGLVTLPHLWKASPEYVTMVEGLKPDPIKHATYFDIEPTTGVPLRGYQRMQVNLLSKKSRSIKLLEYMPTAVFPLIWMEEGFELPDSEVQMLRDQLLKVLLIVEIIKWVLIACGIVMALVGFIMAYIRLRKR